MEDGSRGKITLYYKCRGMFAVRNSHHVAQRLFQWSKSSRNLNKIIFSHRKIPTAVIYHMGSRSRNKAYIFTFYCICPWRERENLTSISSGYKELTNNWSNFSFSYIWSSYAIINHPAINGSIIIYVPLIMLSRRTTSFVIGLSALSE